MAALHTEPLAQNTFTDSMIRHILVKVLKCLNDHIDWIKDSYQNTHTQVEKISCLSKYSA